VLAAGWTSVVGDSAGQELQFHDSKRSAIATGMINGHRFEPARRPPHT